MPETLPYQINLNCPMVADVRHLETDQQSGGIDSNRPGIKPNDDGSFSIYFGPEAPEGWENNWAQTVPGRSFNVMMRLYGPLEP